ncbi:MAG: type IV pilus biogenesis protein PilM, partial [Verrucomicrobiota bacterium]
RPSPVARLTALDLDGTTLRVAHAQARGVFSRVAAVPLELPAEADRNDPLAVGLAVSRALAALGLKPSAVVMGIPRARVVLRTLTLPPVARADELASVVYLQVGRDLPFPAAEAVIDFKVRRQVPPAGVVPEGAAPAGPAAAAAPAPLASPVAPVVPAPGRLEVLAAAVKTEVVDFHRRVAEHAGLKLAALGLLPQANARCVEACQVADGDEAFALVTLRPDEVGIDIIGSQTLLFSRGAAVRPGGEVAAPEAFVSAAAIEVVRSLAAYGGMEVHPPVAKLVVAGATGQEAGVVAALAGRLSLPCTLLDPAASLGLPGEAGAAAAGGLGTLGLVLGYGDPAGLPFDFLHPKRPAVPRDLRRTLTLAVAAGLTLLLVGVLGLRSTLVRRRTAILNAAQAELSEAEKKRPVYRRLTQQTTVVEDWVRGGRDWLEHYAYLTSILPPSEEIYLTSLAVSTEKAIRLAVQARSGETLARLEKQLRAAGYEVKPIAITPGADRFGYEFRSTVELAIPDRLKPDLHRVKPPPRPLDDVSLNPAAYQRGAP